MFNYNYGKYQQVQSVEGVLQPNTKYLVTYAGRPVVLFADAAGTIVNDARGNGTTDAAGEALFFLPYGLDAEYKLQLLNADRSVRLEKTFRPNPPMVEQIFIPRITRDNRYLGVVAIAPTTFTGQETTYTLGGHAYPTRVVYSTKPFQKAFLAIDVGPTEERSSFSFEHSGMTNQSLTYSVVQAEGRPVIHRYQYGTLLEFLMNAAPTPTGYSPAPALPAASVNYKWKVNDPFTNVAGFAYVDLNVQQLAMTTADVWQPVSVSLPAIPAGPSDKVRAMVVQGNHTQQVHRANGQEIYATHTIRLIKATPEAVPAGNYVWTVTFTNSEGTTGTATLTVNVPA